MAVKIFYSYAHEDDALREQLEKQLSLLKRQGIIATWHDRKILAGKVWEDEIDTHLNTAQIILLLISPDFMASDYCYGIEMKRAMERHERGEARVIPIILRPAYWQGASFGKLQTLPTDAKPVISSDWYNMDEAFFNVAEGIRKVVEQLTTHIQKTSSIQTPEPIQPPVNTPERERAKPLPLVRPEDFSLLSSLEHTHRVLCVAFSPDGQMLASGGNSATVKLWNARTGKLLHSLRHPSLLYEYNTAITVYSVAFSPDGQTLASGGVETIKLWNARTGKLLHTLRGHPYWTVFIDIPFKDNNLVVSVVFSPDWQTLASGNTDKTIKLWHVETGAKLRLFRGHQDSVQSVTFSPDGQTLASGGLDKTIMVWNMHTGDLLRTLRDYTGRVSSVAFSPDGQMLASGSSDATIKLWNVRTGDLLRTLGGHQDSVNSVAFSPDRQILASGSNDGTIKLWNVYTGDLLHTLRGHQHIEHYLEELTAARLSLSTGYQDSVNSVAFSPDGQMLASGSQDKTVKIWGKK